MDRAIGRDVHFYLLSEPDQPLGGLRLIPSVTEGNFLSMLDILIVASGPFRVTLRNTGVDLMRTNNALKPGHYDIRPYSRRANISCYKSFYIEATEVYIDTITITDELEESFRTHIFALSSEGYWVQNGFSRWITKKGERETGINSCQNGLHMQSDIHQNFDDPFGIGGRILDPICRNGEDGARDDLLPIFVRGAGEPSFEMDFPPGSDMMGEILSGPEAGKRMEAELFSRLNGVSFT
ncbi:hypothetical protein V1522DRAFT_457334 [Lipomyces starkeyi]